MFEEYASFALGDDEVFPDILPSHITVIEECPRLRKVDLDGMTLPTTDGHEKGLRLRDIEDVLAPASAQVYYAVVLHALNGNRKVGTVLQWCSRFERMLRRFSAPRKVATITLKMYLADAEKSSANDLKTLRSFLKYWTQRRHPGIAKDLKAHIRTSRSPKPASHIEIQATKEHERPFSLEQARSIHRQVDDLYIAGTFNSQDNLLWRLMISEALRPAQLQLLQVQDVTLPSTERLPTRLRVPMVKLHRKPARSHMMSVDVSDVVAVAIRNQLAWLRALLARAPDPDQPLFSVSKTKRGDFLVQKRPLRVVGLITRTRRHIAGHKTDLKNIDLFARRFKHTKLTHLAMLGAPLEVLMYAAFHSSAGSLVRYVNLTDEMMEAYERQMDPHFQLVENAFRGAVASAGEQALVPEEKLILSSDLEATVGGCGANPCGALAPFGCYVCPRFKAFEDGPHEVVLQEMEAKRQVKLNMGLPPETISRDDAMISAARRVIAICEERRDDVACRT